MGSDGAIAGAVIFSMAAGRGCFYKRVEKGASIWFSLAPVDGGLGLGVAFDVGGRG